MLLRSEVLQMIGGGSVPKLRQNVFHTRVVLGPHILGSRLFLPPIEAPLQADTTDKCDWI